MTKGKSDIFLLIIFGFLFLNSVQVVGQKRFPDYGILYDQTSVPRIDITIHPDSLDMILMEGNEQSDHEYLASFSFENGSYKVTIDSVGFRLRGNTSRNAAKKSFKISLNTFIHGQKFQGVEKINLNGEHNDPSILRAWLCWYLFREAGVPAPRSNHVELYINNEYKGLYMNVEHIDEEFTDLRFGNNKGSLYKCLWPADLAYLGSDPELYKFDNGGRLAYELKPNDGFNDYSYLAHFIDILNNTSIEDLPEELSRIFNINSYLKNLAVEELAGHWDAYAFLKNNYYLYLNQGTGKFEYIPYDTDNTLGVDFFDIDWANRDIYHWSNESEDRPLVQRTLQNDLFFDRFSFYMNRLLNDIFTSSDLDPLLNDIQTRIKNSAEKDLYRTLDYGYTYSDFLNAIETGYGGHVKYGIQEFINVRSVSAGEQLTLNKIDPIITLLNVNQPEFGDSAEFEFLVEDDDAINEVKVWFADGGDFIEYSPKNMGNGLFSFTYPGLLTEGIQEFYLTAGDAELNTTRDPIAGWYTISYGTTDIESEPEPSMPHLSVYPNPASDILYVNTNSGQYRVHYFLYDASGRTALSGTVTEQAFQIDLDRDLNRGMYILEIQYYKNEQKSGSAYSKIILVP